LASALIDPRQLKRIRLQVGYTQAGLAEASGLSQSIIAKIEAGAVDPTFGTMSAISKALSASMTTKGKRAGDLMTSPVIGVQETAKLSECIKLMKEKAISQMPVFSGRRVVGTVTEAQLMSLVFTAASRDEILEERVRNHVLPVFAVVGRDTPAEALFSLFKHMPAVFVASGDKVEGIITKIDLLTAGT